jgi:hypothetical protein
MMKSLITIQMISKQKHDGLMSHCVPFPLRRHYPVQVRRVSSQPCGHRTAPLTVLQLSKKIKKLCIGNVSAKIQF